MKKYRFEKVKALAFASIMSAISLVLILVTYFTHDIGLFLIFLLPLCSSLVAFNVDYKYSLIYIISTFLISLIDFQLALFIIIPCLVSGLIFGKMIHAYIQGYFIILIDSIILLLLQIISTYLIKGIYGVNLVETIATILHLNIELFKDTYFLFLFMLCLIECSLNYVIISNEMKKLNYELNERKDRFYVIYICLITSIVLTLSFMNFYPSIAYLFLGFSAFFSVVQAYYNFSFYQKKISLNLGLILIFVSLILSLVLLSVVERTYSPFLFLVIESSILIEGTIIIIYQKLIKKSKILPSIFEN